jgi:hypothetical protein
MDGELILCIPGPWNNRTEFAALLNSHEPRGRYLCVVGMLADAKERDHVVMDFREYEGNLSQAFYVASKGKLNHELLEKFNEHKNCVYLHFPADVQEQRQRLIKFTSLIRDLGGYLVKVDPSGPVNEWPLWLSGLAAQNLLFLYNLVVMHGRDVDHYFSCGMRYFGLPDVEVPVAIAGADVADLIGQFNSWQLQAQPRMEEGLTYSVTPESPLYFVEAHPDHRYSDQVDYVNPYGIWRLVRR